MLGPTPTWFQVADQTRDIHMGPDGNRSCRYQLHTAAVGMDLDMALGRSSGPDNTMAPGGSAGHSDWHGPVAAWPFDTNMATGCSPDVWHTYGP